ncbi:MAG: hypothetical protein RID07_04865 [Lacipirellulaceae bacterium]
MPVNDPHDDDDDFELELEPVDPEVLEHEKRRTADQVKRAGLSVDVNEVYDEQTDAPIELDAKWLTEFRFSMKHLLILTAVLAIGLTVYTQMGGCNLLFWGFVTLVAVGWYFVMKEERALIARRQRRKAELRAMLEGEAADPSDTGSFAEQIAAMKAETQATERPRWEIRFSMQQMLIAFTVAALTLAFSRLFGGETMSLLLAFVALGGLVCYALGYEANRLVVFTWWLLLVMYLIVGGITLVGTG